MYEFGYGWRRIFGGNFFSPVLVCLLFYLCGDGCAVGRVWSRRLGPYPDQVPAGDSEAAGALGSGSVIIRWAAAPPGGHSRHRHLPSLPSSSSSPLPPFSSSTSSPPLSLPPPPPLLARPALLISNPQLPGAYLLPSQAVTSARRRNDCTFSGSENTRAVLQGYVLYKWMSPGS